MPARKPKAGKSFAEKNPHLKNEWHPTKNGDLSAYDFSPNSHRKVWWKCPKGPDHEWESSLANRNYKNGCPFCSGHRVSKSNSLSFENSEIAKEWHPTKNGTLSPDDVSPGSGKKVWWKCSKGPDHEWKAVINSRVNGNGCPVCRGIKVVKSNSLLILKPDIAKQWHPTKNGHLNPIDVSVKSGKKVWWKCPKEDDHEWESSIANRTVNVGCPFCSGHRVSKSNSLSFKNSEIAKEWHPTKNGSLNPEDVTSGSNKNVWWKCSRSFDHEWQTGVNSRTFFNSKCPFCFNRKVSVTNSLLIKRPDLAKEWHPTKNGSLKPNDVTYGTHKKVWWKCSKDDNHEWKTSIGVRTGNRETGCPYCTLTPQSREELIITHELISIFKGINPKGFKTRVKGKLRSIDIYIPDLKLGIEFDGSYWHKDKRGLDKLKTEELEAEGFNIIRVRQKPLKRIFEDDVMAEKKYDGKKITNDILIQIMKDYKLGQSTILKINKYIEMPNLQNEKGLEKYIDMILTEKSEKK